MNPSRNILNRRASALEINDAVLVPQWARGTVVKVSAESFGDATEPSSVKVTLLTTKGPEEIIFWPKYVLTVERRIVVPQLPPLAGEGDDVAAPHVVSEVS